MFMSQSEPDSTKAAELRSAIASAIEAKNLAQADELFRQLRPLVADEPGLLADHAKTVFNMGDAARAATITRRALRMDPQNLELRCQLADIYFDQGRTDAAEAEYRSVLDGDPRNIGALRRLARLLQERHHGSAEAEALLKRALEVAPNDVNVLIVLGAVAANDPARYGEAEEWFKRVLDIVPTAHSALHNLGLMRRFQGDLEGAESYLTRACEAGPNEPDYAFSLGCCYIYMHRPEEALAQFERACALNPKYNAAQVYAAYALFHLHRMPEAWARYEKRLELEVLKSATYSRPRWDGEPLDGRPLLVLPEQGMGDNLQFVRYLRRAAERDAKVICVTHDPLTRLFASMSDCAEIVTAIPEPKYFYRYCSVMSLPYIFKTDEDTIPAEVPYLRAPPDLAATWRERLSAYPGKRIGISWRGNPGHVNDRFRSSSLAEISQLLDVDGATFFSLQKGKAADETELPDGLIELGDEFNDFADTAAAMEALDLIITIDSSLCHLAGALARPVWTMIARGPDFRWTMDGDTSPWYPTMRLYRQETLGDWASVYASMRADLGAFVGGDG